MAWCAENLRDCQGWRDYGLPLRTASNDAAKNFDATIRQIISRTNVPDLKGIAGTMKAMMEADPSFVMGKVLLHGFDLINGPPRKMCQNLKNDMIEFEKQLSDRSISEWERMHITAVLQLSKGNQGKAADIWESILTDFPQDLFALELAYQKYFVFGNLPDLSNCASKVLSHWNRSMPLFGHVKGMLAYGREENNHFTEAVKTANEALEINPQDIWAIHSIAHVHEMRGHANEGIKHLESMVNNWTQEGQTLICHHNWHWALYHMQNEDYEAALGVFDDEIIKRATSNIMGNINDATSLLYRLELAGVDVGKRWEKSLELTEQHLGKDQNRGFNHAHLMMSYVHDNTNGISQCHLEDIHHFIESIEEDNSLVRKNLKLYGFPVCQAIGAYANGEYENVVNLLYPIRKKLVYLGNSNAQREVFDHLLLKSAKISGNNTLAESLYNDYARRGDEF